MVFSISYLFDGKPGQVVYDLGWNGDVVVLANGRWVTLRYADQMGHEDMFRLR